jgi:lysozyme family protein
MADFNIAYTITLKHEGSGTNDPNDRGGLTKFGISQAAHPNVDVATLTPEGAKTIAKNEYWEPLGCDYIEDQALANKVFDTSYPAGVPQVALSLQNAAVDVSGHKLKIDGIIGSMTIEIVNQCNPDVLLDRFRVLMEQYYDHIAMLRPQDQRYVRGWKIRLMSN